MKTGLNTLVGVSSPVSCVRPRTLRTVVSGGAVRHRASRSRGREPVLTHVAEHLLGEFGRLHRTHRLRLVLGETQTRLMMEEVAEVAIAEVGVVPSEEDEVVPGDVQSLRGGHAAIAVGREPQEPLHVLEERPGIGRRQTFLLHETMHQLGVLVGHDSRELCPFRPHDVGVAGAVRATALVGHAVGLLGDADSHVLGNIQGTGNARSRTRCTHGCFPCRELGNLALT